MPWTESDATRFTKKANTPAKRKRWAHIANKALASGDSEATAIKKANGALKHSTVMAR